MVGGSRFSTFGGVRVTLWYASRATGIVALLLLTVVMLLGILVTRQGRLPGLPRFAVSGLHRNLSLLATAFVALHVLTAVADGYVNIPLTAAVVPLTSSYERIWLSLGGISLDLTIALIGAIAVVGAIVWRLAAAARDVPRAERVGLIMTAVHDRASRDPGRART